MYITSSIELCTSQPWAPSWLIQWPGYFQILTLAILKPIAESKSLIQSKRVQFSPKDHITIDFNQVHPESHYANKLEIKKKKKDIWNEKKMWGWWVFQNYRWGVHSVLPPPSTGSSTTLCSRGRSPSSSSLSSTPCQRRKERGDWRQRKQRKQRRWENLWLASLYSSLSARLAQWSNSRSCFIFKIKSGPKNEN